MYDGRCRFLARIQRCYSTLLLEQSLGAPIELLSRGLYLVRELLLVQDVFYLQLRLFRTIYQLRFTLLKPSELFVPEKNSPISSS